jgi:tungstate transport system permease protein
VELILQSFENILELNNSFKEVVLLSLYVSVIATIISSVVSIYLSSYMAIENFLGKNAITLIFNSLMSLPPVVVGLILYIIFSSSGVLGFMDLLYSPQIMIIAQFIIITPIVISLSLKSLNDRYKLLDDYLVSLNASKNKIRRTIIYESRYDLLIIVITGLSRALSEVGAVIIVGGNIDNLTRVMTTSIVLETSRGELSLALSLGISLIFIAVIMNLLIIYIKNKLL